MSILTWTWIIVGITFALYIGIAIWTKASSTGEFYVAEKQVHPIANGMATAADWMSAASFISMAGMISFMGRDGSMYLMGWTGGYVLLALLLAPYLRKYGKFTVPQFVGDRYYSQTARLVALLCAIFISVVYVAGQMRGVGIVFSRFLEVSINAGVIIGMIIVLFYAVLGGMKGITYTQVAQYIVLIIAYLIPAIFISIMITGNPIPLLGYGSTVSSGGAQILGSGQGQYVLDLLDQLHKDLGFAAYTSGQKPMIDVFFITFALMVGTAGLPHVIIRFFTVPKVRDARSSAGWALLFIALLYTTAPAVAAFARTNFLLTINGKKYEEAPSWFKNWEKTKLVGFQDKAIYETADGKKIAVYKTKDGALKYKDGKEEKVFNPEGMKLVKDFDGVMTIAKDPNVNEVSVDRDIMVLANPEIAKLPAWVVALVAAGGLAAALSTAAGLLIVISSAISHDLIKSIIAPNMTEKGEMVWARIAAFFAVAVAGYFGINPPGFVAQVVAFAFGLAAASFFPVIILGIFWKRANKEGAIAGMLVGIVFTAWYIIYYKFINTDPKAWWFGISPEGIGTLGMLLNFVTMWVVSLMTKEPPKEVQDLVESVRYPREA